MNGMWPSASVAIIGLVAWPLATGLLCLVLRPKAAGRWGVFSAVSMLYWCWPVVQQVYEKGPFRYAIGGWKAPLGIEWQIDGLSALLLAMTTTVGIFCSLYATVYFSPSSDDTESGPSKGSHFWPIWFILWTALNSLFLSADLFHIYVTLELLGLSAIAMIGLSEQKDALAAALRYFFIAMVGSLLYLTGVVLLYSQYGTIDWTLLQKGVTGGTLTWCACAFMTTGLIIKTALFPLHVWLPPAHANAPAPVSAILSGLVIKASYYILLRLWFWVFPALFTPMIGHLLGTLGGAAVLWGGLQALRQDQLKQVIAYSTVAQVGYLFALFSLATDPKYFSLAWFGAIYLLLSHAFAKTALFLVAGNIQKCRGDDSFASVQGSAQSLPISLFAFALASVSLVGLPPSGGFLAKWALLRAAFASSQIGWIAILLLGSMMASVYLFRILSLALQKQVPPPPVHTIPRSMEWAPLGLALLAIALMFLSSPTHRLLLQSLPPAFQHSRHTSTRSISTSTRSAFTQAASARSATTRPTSTRPTSTRPTYNIKPDPARTPGEVSP